MPTSRRPSKHVRAPRPLDTARHAIRRATRDGVFLVRDVPANRALKPYTCPGCGNTVAVGTAHVLVWPEVPGLGYESGIDQRRHWHSHCWRIAS